MSKQNRPLRSGLPNRIITVLIPVFFFVAASTLLAPYHGSADDQTRRNSSVQNKRAPDRRAPNVQSAPHYQDSILLAAPPTNPSRILATVDFDLIGLAVIANPASQTVPKNTPTAVLTSVQAPPGVDPSQIIAGLSPNYRVRGDLTGPSLTNPVALEAKIGDPLSIPALSRAGDHVVQNLRVVDIGAAGAPVIAAVTPDSCGITVIDQLLISEVRVSEMSYDEIVRSGIAINDDSYKFFNFTLALATTSGVQNLTTVVAFPGPNQQGPPLVGPPSLAVKPPGVQVPDIFPVMLEAAGDDDDLGGGSKLELPGGGGIVRIPGVVVFPGRIGFLHQFFDAIVIVANGAPNGTPLVLRNLKAKAVLPDNGTPADPADDPLRIAATQTGGAVSELPLHGLGPDGLYGTPDDTTSFSPGQSGQATFLLEGLKEGLHIASFKLEAQLEGLPAGPVTVTGEVPGAVLVRDASFAATFTHPGIVRAGQEYDLALTLYNSGSRDILGAVAHLNRNSVSGAELLGADTGERAFNTTIPRKQSSTVVWRLRSHVTGQVTASYVKVGDGIESGLNLVTGVGDRNIPLSPDSLALPDEVKYLPPDVVEAARALLGQAWSIATAPRGSLPEGVAPIGKDIVYARANELGSAGIRVAFNEPTHVSLQTALRDWLSEQQETPDVGFGDAQRDTLSGFNWLDSIGAQLYQRLTAGQPGITPQALHADLAKAESPRSPFVSALITQSSGAASFGAKLIDPANRRIGFGASATERFGELGTGASLRLSSSDGSMTTGQLLLASRPADGQWSLEIAGWQAGTAGVSLLVPGLGRSYRQVTFAGIAVTQGSRHRITFRPGSTSALTLEVFINGSFQPASATPVVTTINEPPPSLVGAVQVSPELIAGGDKYGRVAGLLFSKPMLQASAETVSHYQIGGGELIGSNPPQIVGGTIKASKSVLKLSGRFVFLALDGPIGPYIRRDITITGVTDTRGVEIAPSNTNSVISPRVSPQGQPPGAYLTGRVLNGDGSPVANAFVEFLVMTCDGNTEQVSFQKADSQGRYVFDYVRNGDCSGVIGRATNPATGSQKRIGTPVIYDGQHMVIDMVFLARGNVSGTVSIAGAPAPNAFVRAIPSLDPSQGTVVQADGLGRYQVSDIPVGPVSVTAVGAGTQSTATGLAAGSIDAPGATAIINVALQNTTAGVVRGLVVNPDSMPSAGSLVVASAVLAGFSNPVPLGFTFTGRDGSFTIPRLPLTSITIDARDVVTGLKVSTAVQLTQSNPERNGIVLTLPGFGGSISGRVVDEGGLYIRGALVQGGSLVVQADVLGFFTVPKVVAGNIALFATDSSTGATGSTAVTVGVGENVTNVQIVVIRPGAISGQIFFQPAGGSPVPLRDARVSVDGNSIVQTDGQGRYSIANVPPNIQQMLRVVHSNNRLAINLLFFVAPGESLVRNITFRPSSIHGKVTQPDGVTGAVAPLKVVTPIPDLTIGFGTFGLLATDKPILTQSEADGSFVINNLNAGTYRVTASSVFFPTPVSKGGTLIAHDDQICNLTLVSTLAGKIQGRVFQPDGTTPVGAGVKVSLGGGFLADVTVQTNQTGHYEFAEVFAAATYALTATDPATGYTNRIGIGVRQNQDTIADIRLLGRGTLRVRVVDGAGAAVTGGRVTIDATNYPPAHRIVDITPETGGVITFDNLSEGSYAISATQNGLSGRAAAAVVLNSTVEATVQLQASGSVQGHVLMADGTTGAGLADVTLFLNGRGIGVTVSSDAEGNVGSFSFPGVPTGEITLQAFDNRSGRTGRATGSVTSEGQTATIDIKLIPIGAVTGHVTQNGAPVDHALVTITANGLSRSLSATTTPDGLYRFTGIPAGGFSVRATGPGGLTGFINGTLTGTTEPLPDAVAGVALAPSVIVLGTVFQPGGIGFVPGARVTLSSGFNTVTDQNGQYRFEFVPLGQINVRVDAATGFSRGVAQTVTASFPGATITIDVTLGGIGNITGDAFDSNGTTRLTTGTVTFTNAEIGSPVVLIAQVQSSGRYEIKDAPAGQFSLKLTVPNRVGAGSASGVLGAGQTFEQALKLEDAGTITGRVKQPDGTLVYSADVTLKLVHAGSPIVLFTHSNTLGVYTFENVPLGTASVSVSDPATGGIASATGVSLTANGQTVTVNDLVLDNTPISITAVSPTDHAANVPTTTNVTIAFSEPALASTVTPANIFLLKGTASVPSTVTLSADGRTATLAPSSHLLDSTAYTVVAGTGLKDLAGLRLGNEFRSSFTTRDETGPTVTAVSPVNGAVDVPVNTTIQVTFNEPLDSAQNLASVVTVTSGPAPGSPISGAVTLNQTGTVATFTPSSSLSESAIHTFTVTGQKDATGNITTNQFASTFTTRDLTAPVIDPLPIDGQRVQTFTPAITATYHDNLSGINTASVVLKLDGNAVTPNTVGGTGLSFTPSQPLARGSHTVTLQVSDNAGNQSAARSATFSIDDSAPVISSFTIAGVAAVSGMTVTSSLRPLFAASYTDDSGISVSNTKLMLGPAGLQVPVAATVTATGLTYQPPADLAEGLYTAEVIVADNSGNISTTSPIQFRVDVDAAEITGVTPNHGSQHGGTSVTLTGNRLLNSNGTAPASVVVGGWPAKITSATAGAGGAPDQLVIVTPANAPGAAIITITNDRGTGSLVGGFTYDADPKTPFAVEADTVLLWHLDEISDGAVTVSTAGPDATMTGTANVNSKAVPGRFAGGRSKARIAGSQSTVNLSFGTTSFTVEFWMKTGAVSQTAYLVDRSRSCCSDLPSFRVELQPSGALRGYVNDTSFRAWEAVMSASQRVDDNQWHAVAMVVDRGVAGDSSDDVLKLYVDGSQKVSAFMPPSTQFGGTIVDRTDTQLIAGGSGSGTPFDGIIDEVRVSSSAHNAQQILRAYEGAEGTLGLVIMRVAPQQLRLGFTEEIIVTGYNLSGVTSSVSDASGAPIPSEVIGTSATQARIRVTVGSQSALGSAQMHLSSVAGTASVTLPVIDLNRSVYEVELDTKVLWHLDETGSGAVRVIDSGPLSIDGTASSSSEAKEGRFGGGRKKARVVADDDFGILSFGTTTFTVEFWMKTGPVSQTAYLVDKSRSCCSDVPTFRVELQPSGALRGYVNDTSFRVWEAVMKASDYDVDDDQWHAVAMVVDRGSAGDSSDDVLRLYVDGVQRASAPMPPPTQFGGTIVDRTDTRLIAGGSASGIPFDGLIDEVRLSFSAHAGSRILEDFYGTSGMRVVSYNPKNAGRNRAAGAPEATQITIKGYNLSGIAGRVVRNGQLFGIGSSVDSSEYREAILTLTVPASTPLGPAELVLSKSGQPDITLNIQTTEQNVFAVESDTRVLWHLDETGNGAARVIDSGPLSIDGTASSSSEAKEGRFGGGRKKARVVADDDFGILSFGTTSFTVEFWMKTGPVSQTAYLVDKSRSCCSDVPTFRVELQPSGALRGYVNDTSFRVWEAVMKASDYDVDDDQWHAVAMVVDRGLAGDSSDDVLRLYVDGVQRASAPMPPPAQFGGTIVDRTDTRLIAGGSASGIPFDGLIDEVRVSFSAHSANQVASDYFGFNGVRVTFAKPSIIQQGATSVPISLFGTGLKDASVSSARPDVTVTVNATSYDVLQCSIATQSTVPLGPLQLSVTDALNQTTTTELTVVDQQPFVNDPSSSTETTLLWHLNEPGDGAVSIIGSGDGVTPAVINGTASASSIAATGRFGGGRQRARIVGDTGSASVSFATTSFTMEFWMKTGPLSQTAYLVDKSRSCCSDVPVVRVELQPSGALRGFVSDTSFRAWEAVMKASDYDVDDDQWHAVAMVVDRGLAGDSSDDVLRLYVDGVQRASAPMPPPAQFGGTIVDRTDTQLIAGGSVSGTFAGILDEIRIVNYARTAAQIHDTWFGTSTSGLNLSPARRLDTLVAKSRGINGGLFNDPLTAFFPAQYYGAWDAAGLRRERLRWVLHGGLLEGVLPLFLKSPSVASNPFFAPLSLSGRASPWPPSPPPDGASTRRAPAASRESRATGGER